jgi:hypothetical protein
MSPSLNIQAAQLVSLKSVTSNNAVQPHKFVALCTLHFSRHIQHETHKPHHLPYHVSFHIIMIMSILCLLDRASSYSWINWNNLMSLYESYFIAQHVSNVITFILRSRRLYVGVLFCIGVLVRFGWSRVVYECRLVHQPAPGYHPTPAEPYQYTSTQRNRTIHLHTVVRSWGWM